MAMKPMRRSSLFSHVIRNMIVNARGCGGLVAKMQRSLTPHNAPPSFAPVTDVELKSTPLYDEHRRAGAKIVPFGGWLMPVMYSGINDEHQAVRNNVGVFDISHMGQL